MMECAPPSPNFLDKLPSYARLQINAVWEHYNKSNDCALELALTRYRMEFVWILLSASTFIDLLNVENWLKILFHYLSKTFLVSGFDIRMSVCVSMSSVATSEWRKYIKWGKSHITVNSYSENVVLPSPNYPTWSKYCLSRTGHFLMVPKAYPAPF